MASLCRYNSKRAKEMRKEEVEGNKMRKKMVSLENKFNTS